MRLLQRKALHPLEADEGAFQSSRRHRLALDRHQGCVRRWLAISDRVKTLVLCEVLDREEWLQCVVCRANGRALDHIHLLGGSGVEKSCEIGVTSVSYILSERNIPFVRLRSPFLPAI